MKRTPLTRRTPLSRRQAFRVRATQGLVGRRTGLKSRSKKTAAEMKAYIPERDDFLTVHEWCEFPGGCGSRSQVVHHRNGRNGPRLRDQRFWSASCNVHNDYAETETGHSLEIGWLIPINQRGETDA